MQSFDRALSDGRTIRVRTTDRTDGDLSRHVEPSLIDPRRAAIVDRPWVWLEQVHGDRVVVIGNDDDPASLRGAEADALLTMRSDIALSVQSADCGTIGLWTDDGVIAAVHAGWRGLQRGTVESAVMQLRAISSAPIHAVVGPTIGPECYEFGAEDLRSMRELLGEDVEARTSGGMPALDVRVALDVILDRCGVELVLRDPRCTSCDATQLWSHRARGDEQRQALVIWMEP